MNPHQQRLAQLRNILVEKNISGLYLPMDDEHLNEYVVESGKRISFVGNVHVVIVNEDQAEKPPARILTSDAEAGGVGR